MKRRLRQGFSLLELILGLAVFSIIAVTMYSTFSSGMMLSRRSDESNEIYREARMSFELISRELENMVPYDFSYSYPDEAAFRGSRQDIQFIVEDKGVLQVVHYSLEQPEQTQIYKTLIGATHKKNVQVVTRYEETQDVYYLVRTEQPLLDYLSANKSSLEQEVISTNISRDGLRFSFGFIADEETPAPFWLDSWAETYIPSNVRVEIDFLTQGKDQRTVTLTQDVLVPSGYWGMQGS